MHNESCAAELWAVGLNDEIQALISRLKVHGYKIRDAGPGDELQEDDDFILVPALDDDEMVGLPIRRCIDAADHDLILVCDRAKCGEALEACLPAPWNKTRLVSGNGHGDGPEAA